ncbi:acidic leucine-rich nuclear phosphoprotein 32 family member B-like [Oscarella lobularis]|uniref:acidic leucine-rich nuclear phosphoprotein 32 family member B-like n=1 Tax=Oscarella lobularis TaxID=121494 RepID=UPI00331320A9
MEKRIALESRGKNPSEVSELILDNCKATTIDGLTNDFVNLESLSLINVGLTSLRHFPKLPKLRKLDLSENRISGGLQHLSGCPMLGSLSLSNNRIKSLDILEAISDLKELKSLDLYQCEVTGIDDYRENVFKLLPQLQWLDGVNREGQAESDSEEDEDESSVASSDVEEADNDEEDEDEVPDGLNAVGVAADDEEEDDDDDDDEEDEGPGLAYLQKSDLVDEEEEEDFQPGEVDEEEDEDEDDEDDEDDDVVHSHGGKAKEDENRRKRKRDDVDEENESKREK